ncbi:MAG: tripartite tricarboxylate transporter permease [Candidatus Nanoarchaeia archaeon]
MILIAVVFGICCGIVTGLIPGVHVNLVAILLVSLGGVFVRWFDPVVVACVIISTAVTHTFLDVIPSVFLGVPDADMVMSVLPAHKLTLEGRGYEAIRMATIGSLLSLLVALCLFPILVFVVPLLYDYLKAWIGWIILFVVIFLFIREGKWWAVGLFSLSGMLGLIVLNMVMEQPLLPMLSGLFGVSSLVLALQDDSILPEQRITEELIVLPGDLLKCTSAATLSGWITSMFPGLGSAQAAVLSSVVFRDLSSHLYLIVVGGINTVNFTLSLVTFYTIEKTRNGAIVAVKDLIGGVTLRQVLLFCGVALFVGGIATFLAFFLGKKAAKYIGLVPYEMLSYSVMGLVVLLVFVFSGWIGLLVLFVSSALGMLAPLLGVARIHLMGCLLAPVLLFFL